MTPSPDIQTPQPGMEAGPGRKLRIAAVGDLHVGETSHRVYRDLFDRVHEDADVLCLCGDLVNFGAANAKDNEDFVSLALGARYRTCSAATVGAAYEFPLTDDDATLMDYRVTVDITVNL